MIMFIFSQAMVKHILLFRILWKNKMNLIIPLVLILANGVKSDEENGNYCSDVTGPNHEEIDVEKECRSGLPCMVKCCGSNEVLYKVNKTVKVGVCINIEQLGKIINVTEKLEEIKTYSGLPILSEDFKYNTSKSMLIDFHVLYRKRFATTDQCMTRHSSDFGKITEKGVLEYILRDTLGVLPPKKKSVQAPNFCVEILLINRMNGTMAAKYKVFISGEVNNNKIKDMFLVYGKLVSAFFILLLLVVYGLLKQLHSNLHGMMLMVFCGSLMIYVVIDAATKLHEYKLMMTEKNTKNMSKVCEVLGPISYFFLLSTFFWMNTMSFDIWWTFRGTRKVREIHRRGIYVKFLTYALYAWGIPLVLMVIAIIIEKSDVPESVAKPMFKICQRKYGNKLSTLYKYLPMVVLVTANVVLYIMTIYNIWLVQSSMKGFNGDSTQNKKNKNQFIIYLKLSVIMGVNWVVELAQELNDGKMPEWLFYILNIFNLLIGVVIFIIMVCKRSIFLMLCKRFNIENRWTRRRGTEVRTTTRTDLSKSNTSCKTKETEDSVQLESIQDTLKMEEQKPLNPQLSADTLETDDKKPRFSVTKM